MRGSPNKDHDVAWVYTRPGLPVEITANYENWRRIRDWDGAEGWVYPPLLSGKRTAFVAKLKAASAPAALHRSADPNSPREGDAGAWCSAPSSAAAAAGARFLGNGFDGWIEQERLWGVYPNEKVE